MARTKKNRKKIVKKHPEAKGKHQQKGSFTFRKEEPEDHDKNVNETSSTLIRQPVIEIADIARSSTVLPESTPSSQRAKAVHVKRLTDVFKKLPNNRTNVVGKKLTQHANISQNVVGKGNRTTLNNSSANSLRAVGTQVEQETANVPLSKDVNQLTSCPREKQQTQKSMKFYCYPVENPKKWIKDEVVKSRPHKKRVPKKIRTPTTDELTNILLWQSPSKRRTLKDLTDLEVAFTVFKYTSEEFSECVSDRSILMLIKKYAEYFERGIIEKLQNIGETRTMQQEINKLHKENKALSLRLGSLVDKKIKLENEMAKRRVPRRK